MWTPWNENITCNEDTNATLFHPCNQDTSLIRTLFVGHITDCTVFSYREIEDEENDEDDYENSSGVGEGTVCCSSSESDSGAESDCESSSDSENDGDM